MSTDTATVVFSLEELWILQSVVRHEVPQRDQWQYPPAGLELNDQIAQAILFCVENGQSDSAVILSRGDCLVIDYCVRADMKSPSGLPIGKNILLKSFAARREIAEGPTPIAAEPEQPSLAEVAERLRELRD
jgi:hypothetical protein